MSDYEEVGLELASDTDREELKKLYAVPDEENTTWRSILEVWREVLSNAETARDDTLTPQWCTRIVSKYAGIGYGDCGTVYGTYIDLLVACHDALVWAMDAFGARVDLETPEEDRTFNDLVYFNVLILWQQTFLSFEMDWDWGDPNAAADLAGIGEAHQALFGQLGLTGHLDNIQFQFGDDEQEIMLSVLNEMKEGS